MRIKKGLFISYFLVHSYFAEKKLTKVSLSIIIKICSSNTTFNKLMLVVGIKKNFELHLKECEWRYGRQPDILRKELWRILKKYLKH